MEALGACGPEAAPVLGELLTGIPISSSDRDSAFDTLAQTGNAEVAIPFLLKAFKSGEDSEMRAAAIALGRWSTRYDEEVRTDIIETFIGLLDHSDTSHRRAALAGLAKSGDFHCIPLLRPLLDDPAVHAEAQSAIRALEEAMEPYRMSFGIPPHERTMSVNELIAALEAREAAWASFALQLRCDVADSATRKQIYDKLTGLAIKQAGLPIEKRIASVDALNILGAQEKHRDEAVQAVLKILAETTDPLTHDMCYSALGRLGGPQAVRALKKAILKDAAPDLLMQHIYQNLYQYLLSCGPEAVPILLEDIDELAPDKRRMIQQIVDRLAE